MPAPGSVRIRDATATDAGSIAALHAESWRHHYRGAFTDAFLDGDVMADRLAVWSTRLDRPHDGCTVVAESSSGKGIVGFAHTVFDADETWGALVDNLHVDVVAKRRGIGTRLLRETAHRLLARDAGGGLYLWVLEQNRPARAFYEALGGVFVGRRSAEPPGGVPGRLEGEPGVLLCAWTDPRQLLAPRVPGGREA